uniref:Calmodulin-binding family protein n=1 Tax=Rhizophora mucronata TaxID=61149 RepID=A0A2P2NB57_RHIMU
MQKPTLNMLLCQGPVAIPEGDLHKENWKRRGCL